MEALKVPAFGGSAPRLSNELASSRFGYHVFGPRHPTLGFATHLFIKCSLYFDTLHLQTDVPCASGALPISVNWQLEHEICSAGEDKLSNLASVHIHVHLCRKLLLWVPGQRIFINQDNVYFWMPFCDHSSACFFWDANHGIGSAPQYVSEHTLPRVKS